MSCTCSFSAVGCFTPSHLVCLVPMCLPVVLMLHFLRTWLLVKIVSIISLVMRCIFNFQDQISSNFFSVQSSCKSLKKWLQLESESRWLESTSLLLAIQSPVCMFTICCENIKDETQSPLAVHSAVPPLKSIWSSSLWSLSDSDICVHHPRQSHKLLPQSHSC